jgi:hypothetical protein
VEWVVLVTIEVQGQVQLVEKPFLGFPRLLVLDEDHACMRRYPLGEPLLSVIQSEREALAGRTPATKLDAELIRE